MSSRLSDYRGFLRSHHRPAHARRTAETWAPFFLDRLRPGMSLLDIGCGPGSITIGLADAVAPAVAVGVDLDPGPASEAISFVVADGFVLPFGDATFDAVFVSMVLQHLAEPRVLLAEARRISRPGALIGVVDADWDGGLSWPDDEDLARGRELMERLRHRTSPRVGKQLRALLHEVGFERCEAGVTSTAEGSADAVAGAAASQVRFFTSEPVIDEIVNNKWATAEEVAAVAAAWERWGADPGAFAARMGCYAVGWAPG